MSEPRHGTIVHFMAHIGGGVWSVAKALAAQHRPRWRVVLVAMQKGSLRQAFAAEVKEYFDDACLLPRPSIPGIYHLAPVNVASAVKALRVDARQGKTVFLFHTGPYTPWVFRLPRRPMPGRWLACFHGSRGNFGDLNRPLKQWINALGVRRLLRRQFTLVAVSHRSAADCAEMYGCRESDFHVIYNGTTAPQGVRRVAGSGPHRPFHVGFMGTVMPIKGWRKVVAAVEQLRREGLDLACSIVGDGPEFSDLQSLAAQHGAWLTAPGFVSSPETNVLPSLDALVLPSEFEGHPEVVLEALSCGVPCISSDVGGCAETVRHDQEGYILKQNTPDEIAACLKRLAGDDKRWTRMSASCMARHEAMFTTERMADHWERLFLEADSPAVRPPAAVEAVDNVEVGTP